jgi:hypothetical protein
MRGENLGETVILVDRAFEFKVSMTPYEIPRVFFYERMAQRILRVTLRRRILITSLGYDRA